MTRQLGPRQLGPVVLVGLGLLSGCTMTGPGNLKVHEALLYGGTQERIVWVYGTLSGGSAGSLKVNSAALDLKAQVADPLALPGTLSVNGKATYRLPTASTSQKLTVARRADGSFVVSPLNAGEISAVYYTDGRTWTKLSGTSGGVGGVATRGLEGAGRLTSAEAGALGQALLGQGSLAVAVLAEQAIPDAPLSVEPAPTESLRTGLYVLPNVPTLGGTTLGGTAPGVPAQGTQGGAVTFTELASGSQAAVNSFSVQLATTQAAATALYAQAYGRQSSVPGAAAVGTDTLVGVFLGQRPTGGYGVSVVGVQASGSALTVTVRLRAPGAGAITTQALTSPWTIIRVPGRYTQVTVQDESGQPLRTSISGNDR